MVKSHLLEELRSWSSKNGWHPKRRDEWFQPFAESPTSTIQRFKKRLRIHLGEWWQHPPQNYGVILRSSFGGGFPQDGEIGILDGGFEICCNFDPPTWGNNPICPIFEFAEILMLGCTCWQRPGASAAVTKLEPLEFTVLPRLTNRVWFNTIQKSWESKENDD